MSFDRGFRQGYESGQVHGEVTARDHAGYNSEPSACVAGSAPPPGQPQKLCDGYSRGYAMGYDDGYIASGSGIDRNTSAKNLR